MSAARWNKIAHSMPAAQRTIFHVDMDAFFVSVEELFDPTLKGKAVVVGGQRDERGVVSAASYEARKFGVHSAMPLRTAAKLCPHAVFVDGHPERYRDYSAKVYQVLDRFSPKLEMVSIDEAYVDMTGTERLHGPPMRAAHALHVAMKAETQLNCSIGIGTSRLVAKICSDQAKPNGVLWIVPGGEAEFLAPLDVRKIPGVGKVMEKRLLEQGIEKIGDLARQEERWLEANFGALGVALAGKSRGLDAGAWFESDIGEDDGPRSISHEHTYSVDTNDAASPGSDAGATDGDGVPPPARAETACAYAAIEAALFRFPHAHPRAHVGAAEFGGCGGAGDDPPTVPHKLERQRGPAARGLRVTF